MKEILLVGAGGHARSVVDSIEKAGIFRIRGFVDVSREAVLGKYDRIGSDEDLSHIRKSGVENAAICLGFLGEGSARQQLFRLIKHAGFHLPPIIDPSAAIANEVKIGEGSFIGKNAVVNSMATIGAMSIVNSGAIVEHDCSVGDFSHIAVNATLCGGSSIGEAVLIGAGAVVLQGRRVESNVIVGAGSIVLSDVPNNAKVVGIYHE